MKIMKALAILLYMLDHADQVKPHTAETISVNLRMNLSAVYRSFKKLGDAGLVQHVTGGYILGNVILLAGSRYHSAIARIDIQTAHEKLYGTAKTLK